MADNVWYNNFMEMLHKKHSKKNELTDALMDLLCLEREAVYRRLRGDVIFTANEIAKVAIAWNISLDEVMRLSSKFTFHMQHTNYLTPSEEDMKFMKKRVSVLKDLKHSSNSEYMVVCNNLSRSLSAGFANLYKFNIFKWAYQYGNETENIKYSEITLAEELIKEVETYYRRMKYVTNTSYILDNRIFDYTIHEVKFFHSIFLITDEEKELIKNDLYSLLDYMLEVAKAGSFPETKNKVQIYISMFNVNTNYSYFYNGKIEACRIHTFNMHDNITYNSEMIEKFKVWMQKTKKTSYQISEANEKSRIEFFTQQRQLIDSL